MKFEVKSTELEKAKEEESTILRLERYRNTRNNIHLVATKGDHSQELMRFSDNGEFFRYELNSQAARKLGLAVDDDLGWKEGNKQSPLKNFDDIPKEEEGHPICPLCGMRHRQMRA